MKIILSYAYAGIGHKKASEAIKKALSSFNDVELKLVDVLDYTNPFFKFLYPRVYLFLINRASFLWGFFYYFFDLKIIDIFIAPVRRLFHNLHAKGFIEFVLEEKPDVVVCTHFLPAEVVSILKRKDIFKGRLITVITDFLPHSFWMARSSDYFIVAVERTKKDLLRRGIKEEKIKNLGIPCDPLFSISKDRKFLIKRLGLEESFFNILIMSGGFGTGPIRKIVYSLNSLEPRLTEKIQLIVICGKNKNLFEELKRLDLKVKISIFGYRDDVDEFMQVSDCIITKSGGLTVSEALSKNLPMIIIKPIPGQETRNCKILTDYGTAVRANSPRKVRYVVKDFIDLPERIIGMRARINLLASPNAARDIASFIVQL